MDGGMTMTGMTGSHNMDDDRGQMGSIFRINFWAQCRQLSGVTSYISYEDGLF